MKKLSLTPPELMFIIGTRAALAAGVALLVSGRLAPKTRRNTALALMGIGGATTLPAAKLALGKRSRLQRILRG